AGYEGAKAEIAEGVDFLREPDRYARAGAMVPRGVLMVGPPGTGKTLLARAVAGGARVAFFSGPGSRLLELVVGVGAARAPGLCRCAVRAGAQAGSGHRAPSCPGLTLLQTRLTRIPRPRLRGWDNLTPTSATRRTNC